MGTLKTAILSENRLITKTPTLTTSSNNTNDENGLYQSTETNTRQPTYYFRGIIENNYVEFAEQLWKIVRVNEDGTIRIMMQDGINSNAIYQFNLNYTQKGSIYYSNSDVENGAKRTLDNWYQTNIASKKYSSYVAKGNYFCEQAKVTTLTEYNTYVGVEMKLYTEYKPNFKCSTDENGKGLVNSNIGLISYDEVVYAGGYYNQANNNYYLNNSFSFWTMSPACFAVAYADNWVVTSNGSLNFIGVHNSVQMHPVINLNANIKAVGLGTSNKPFIVE